MAKKGRKQIDIDPVEIERLASIGATIEEMAIVLGCSDRTLYRRKFVSAIKKGTALRKISLRRAQYKSAIDQNNVTMQIWLGKQDLGQTDKIETVSRVTVDWIDKFVAENPQAIAETEAILEQAVKNYQPEEST